MNDNLDTLDSLLAPDRTFYVSPRFTTGNCPALANATDRRHYDTIQAAIDAGEAKAYDRDGYVIRVGAGVYNENLTLERSVRIMGPAGFGPGFYGATAQVRGVATTKAAVITIDPLESDWQRFEFIGLNIDNAYDQAEGAEIATPPYAVDMLAQTAIGGVQNVCAFLGCHFRMQTWGSSHVWTTGLAFAGNNAVTFDLCQIQGLDYGGGAGSAGIRYMLSAVGHSTGNNCNLRVNRCKIANAFTGTGSHYAFAQAGDSRVEVSESFLDYATQAAALISGGSNNTNFGLSTGTQPTYRNTLGLDLVRML